MLPSFCGGIFKLTVALPTNILRGSGIFKFDFALPNMTLSGNLLLIISGVGEYQSYIYLFGRHLLAAAPHHLLLFFPTVWRLLCFESVYL